MTSAAFRSSSQLRRGLFVLIVLGCLRVPAQSPVVNAAAAEDRREVDAARALSTSFRRAIDFARPSIVSIRTVGRWADPAAPPGGFRAGNGTGLVVERSGGVLTSFHVVEDADAVFVGLPDGREIPASEIRVDPWSDLALVRFRGAADLPEARWADSADVEVGDWVLAAGNAFGLGFSANPGTVSGKDREFAEANLLLLQTNAPSNPGNSGGPVLNLRGEVIGISEGIYTVEGGLGGIALAVPADAARFVARELGERGTVRWAYLGLGFETLSPDLAAALGLSAALKGAIVTGVAAGSPAAAAGLRVGDVVTSCGGSPLGDAAGLIAVIQRAEVGKPLSLATVRDGQAVDREVRPGQIPKNARPDRGPEEQPPYEWDEDGGFTDTELGITVTDLPAERKGSAPGGTGVLVSRVEPGSPAQYLNVHAGTVVTHVGLEPVADVASFKSKSLARPAGAGAVLLIWCADCGERFFALRPELARPPVRTPPRERAGDG